MLPISKATCPRWELDGTRALLIGAEAAPQLGPKCGIREAQGRNAGRGGTIGTGCSVAGPVPRGFARTLITHVSAKGCQIRTSRGTPGTQRVADTERDNSALRRAGEGDAGETA